MFPNLLNQPYVCTHDIKVSLSEKLGNKTIRIAKACNEEPSFVLMVMVAMASEAFEEYAIVSEIKRLRRNRERRERKNIIFLKNQSMHSRQRFEKNDDTVTGALRPRECDSGSAGVAGPITVQG